MKPPGNVKELMTFLGFVQYLGKFIPNLSEISAPLRHLLSKDVAWHWEEEQMKSFEKLKQLVTEARSIDSQQNYAQIEKETLAITFGCTKLHQYIFGRHMVVESDHKPLQSIFRKSLHSAPPRLQRSNIFEFENQQYLVSVDHYSKWPEVVKLPRLSSYATIQCLKSQFSRNELPDKVLTDNGPQFSSKEFRDFSKEYGFVYVTSSPHFPQASGQAERTVTTVKNLLSKAKDPYKSLLDYGKTNIEEICLSPAQMFLGRRLKTELPTASLLLSAATSSSDLKMRMETRKTKQKVYFDRHAGRELRPLESGEKIVMKHGNDWIPGNVMNKHSNRSYLVKTSDGTIYRRNRKHIRPTAAEFKRYQDSKEPEISDSSNLTITKESSDEILPKAGSTPQSSDLPKYLETVKSSSCIVSRSGHVVKPPKKFEDFAN
ncbi:uncharacterized protein LOC133182663 [Saccostrea echinata]|uniref:uncharacterized protein LOC133182663 n=1 Tax=Saccostrea echinata TaxID=191078 RepID=UPI002A836F40|nr:uncharacterized protein LOC133182663 [Saccostrea echinata]